MKKLMFLVWGITMSISLDAQVVLEGEFNQYLPTGQIWDGTNLIYRSQGKTVAYNSDSGEKAEIFSGYPENLKYQKGLFFIENKKGKFQLWEIGKEEPKLPYEFDYVESWINGVILAGFEQTGKTHAYRIYWISDSGKLLASHSLDSIGISMGLDYAKYRIEKDYYGAFGGIHTVYSEGLIALENPKTKRWGYFDLNLNPIIPMIYSEAEPFFEGLAAVKNEDGFWGYIDSNGNAQIPFKYSIKPGRFSDGLAQVKTVNLKIGFINKQGELLIPTIYDEASLFYKGYSFAMRYGLNSKWVLLNDQGVEEQSPGGQNSPQKSGYLGEKYLDYNPYRTLVDLIDEGLGVFVYGNISRVFTLDGELISEHQDAIIHNLKDGKMLSIERFNPSKNYTDQNGLINSKGEWLIKVKRSEF
ncbi:WG repeat-containing protein [Algoriphagus pacificus]|uniref:WG repeat-containing protein n=1 Tax=Algoriphagus pacificus TaxID=2811234 RepID=A0ABS3CII1_9BACT|nr:WG repeat-containing protein [Algoriphagus pacificus]MBN7816905.1 WG repeat-containing protein [Algoriphagus pacificus]